MTANNARSLAIDQCLFGYSDGHQLLASSTRLSAEAMSTLLRHSDLVPGFSSRHSDRYWTGIPLTGMKQYALMRTWLAPEMRRPGCVWTHVILIGFADMARVANFSALVPLFVRPESSTGFDSYKRRIGFNVAAANSSTDRTSFSKAAALKVLRSFYSSISVGLLSSDSDDLDASIFAVWSQQWPRLRRVFAFQTAGTSIEISRRHFDLRVVNDGDLVRETAYRNIAKWEQVALDDLAGEVPPRLRRFLWRYGADIRRGRERFKFLVELFITTQLNLIEEGEQFLRLLDRIAEELPQEVDGRLLKEDLISCGDSKFSLFPAGDPIDVLGYLMRHEDSGSWPPPPAAVFEQIYELWPTRSHEILEIADRAITENSRYADDIIEKFSSAADPESFLRKAIKFPEVRRRMIESQPGLIDSPDLEFLPTDDLAELLGRIPDRFVDVALRRLLPVEDTPAARVFAAGYSTLIRERVVNGLVAGEKIGKAWIDEVAAAGGEALINELVQRALATSTLSVAAELIGLDVTRGLSIPICQWGRSVLRSRDDVTGISRQRLLAFLIGLALGRPEAGCEPLFEIAFDTIHFDIAEARLPYDASLPFRRYLPHLNLWQQWDMCLRLRMAVVNAYVRHELDLRSFCRLTSDPDTLQRLKNIAADTKAGRLYLRRARSV